MVHVYVQWAVMILKTEDDNNNVIFFFSLL